MTVLNDLRNQIESLLFSSGRAMPIDEIANVINLEKKQIRKGLKELKEFYDSLESGLMVTEEGDSWKLNIREKYVSLVTKIIADTELNRSVLETLSIIAWKSPVLQSEVIKIRTNKAYEHIKELVDGGFVNKEKSGRSYRLRIAEKFFEYFDVPGDKGIKEAFEDVKIPKKKEPEKIGDLDVVPVQNNTKEHGKTAEIFGSGSESDSSTIVMDSASENLQNGKQEDSQDETGNEKDEIPPVDKDFLDKVNAQIDEISKRNDENDGDALFTRAPEEDSENNKEDSVILDDNPANSESIDDEDSPENDTEELDQGKDVASDEKDESGVSDDDSEEDEEKKQDESEESTEEISDESDDEESKIEEEK